MNNFYNDSLYFSILIANLGVVGINAFFKIAAYADSLASLGLGATL